MRAARPVAACGTQEGADCWRGPPADRRQIGRNIIFELEVRSRARGIKDDGAGAARLGNLFIVRKADAARDVKSVGQIECEIAEGGNFFIVRQGLRAN